MIPGIANIDRSAYSRRVRVYLGGFLVLALWVGAIGCGPKAPNYDYSKEPDPRKAEFVIGVGDELSINVWKNDALSTEGVVRPDGTITMPLVGDMRAVGKTPTQLRSEIAERVAEYVKINQSEITVAINKVNSYRFSIGGEVGSPGVFTADHYVTVAEALALAGGFTRFADRDEIVLSRRDPSGQIRQIPIVYDLIEDGSHPEMNLVVLPGDSLHVP